MNTPFNSPDTSFPEADEPRVTPCPQMRTLLSQMSDGTLRGLLRRYAHAHVERCAHCQEALSALQRVVRRLRHLPEAPETSTSVPGLATERWTTVEQAMRTSEAQNRAATTRLNL